MLQQANITVESKIESKCILDMRNKQSKGTNTLSDSSNYSQLLTNLKINKTHCYYEYNAKPNLREGALQ